MEGLLQAQGRPSGCNKRYYKSESVMHENCDDLPANHLLGGSLQMVAQLQVGKASQANGLGPLPVRLISRIACSCSLEFAFEQNTSPFDPEFGQIA